MNHTTILPRLRLQQLRDASEKASVEAAERGDKDSADAWETIELVLDEANEKIAIPYRIIQARLPRDAAIVEFEAGEMINSAYAALDCLVKAIKAIECWDDDCPYLVAPVEDAIKALKEAEGKGE